MDRPVIKRFGNLRRDDFATHPIWVNVKENDHDEPWWMDVDEEAFRPRVGPLPASPAEDGLLVRAVATLRDGTPLAGFLTPALGPADADDLRPHVFVGDLLISLTGMPEPARQAFLATLRRPFEHVFPIAVAADPTLCLGTVDVVVQGN